MIASMMNNLGLDELSEDRVRPRTMIASMMNNLGLDVSLSMPRMMNNLGLDTHSVINAHHTCPKPKANSHRVLSAWFAGTRGNFADIHRGVKTTSATTDFGKAKDPRPHRARLQLQLT